MVRKRSLAQLRAIFANLKQPAIKRAAVYSGVGAGAVGVYLGAKKLNQFISQRRVEKRNKRFKDTIKFLKGKPDPYDVKILTEKYQELIKGISPQGHQQLREMVKEHRKLDLKSKRPRSLNTIIKDLHKEALIHRAYEAGAQFERETATDLYTRKIKNLEQMGSSLKEAKDALAARGLATPSLAGVDSAKLDEIGSTILGEDLGSKLDKARDWLDRRRQKHTDGLISTHQWIQSANKFNRYREKLLKKASREPQSKPSPNYYKQQDRKPDAYEGLMKRLDKRSGRRIQWQNEGD